MKGKSSQRTAAFVALLIITAAWPWVVQFHVTSLLLLALWVGLYLLRGWHQRDWLVIATLVAFFLSTFAPVDLYIPGLSGSHYGKKKPGIRWVRHVRGKISLTACEERYGEFIYRGGAVQPFDANWLLVLDWGSGHSGPEILSRPSGPQTNSAPEGGQAADLKVKDAR